LPSWTAIVTNDGNAVQKFNVSGSRYQLLFGLLNIEL
jgi:hypothetical protein